MNNNGSGFLVLGVNQFEVPYVSHENTRPNMLKKKMLTQCYHLLSLLITKERILIDAINWACTMFQEKVWSISHIVPLILNIVLPQITTFHYRTHLFFLTYHMALHTVHLWESTHPSLD